LLGSDQPHGLVVRVNDYDHEVLVRFPVLPWGFFFEVEDPHVDHDLGSLVEVRFKAPPGNAYSYLTIHLIRTT
jgi:hypothetical protein